MLAGGVMAEMVLLDLQGGTITVSAPFQPEDAQFFPLDPPFSLSPAEESDSYWTGASIGDFSRWLSACIDRAARRGEVLTLDERDAQGRGFRRVQCLFERGGESWSAVVATNAPRDDEMWSQGWTEDGTTFLRFPNDAESSSTMAMVASMLALSWAASPLDLVLGWSPAPDGPRPRPAELAGSPTGKERSPRSTPAKSRHAIDALHIPCSVDEPIRVVSIDRRDVIGWYPLVSGGPVEAAPLRWAELPPHELYVNSRYVDLDASTINERATDLLDQCRVPMALDHLRGDTLLVAAANGAAYPKSVSAKVIEALCG